MTRFLAFRVPSKLRSSSSNFSLHSRLRPSTGLLAHATHPEPLSLVCV
jgi:hypothetical protein